ncbi:hypothetical protein GAGA_3676 [Paraglaciecola agarilytica NO2]|uniref:Uncharacterized protein n=1 Tax=Paraglaciecola agarilytica NO2 TaxID=1125747 RepID=A0ABQ0IBT5_9ALTE|nr:hypothetical protein GAGA_3676 [Paraglaciecola agarilytica NO2]
MLSKSEIIKLNGASAQHSPRLLFPLSLHDQPISVVTLRAFIDEST